MLKGSLFIVSAPSGAGKTSLVRALIKTLPNVIASVSHTTRPIRAGEQNGVDYHFVSHAEFKEMIHKNIFLEHASVFGNYYGTSRLWIEDMREKDQDIILEIDWQGARQIRSLFFGTQSIYILPPSKEALLERLQKRHQDNPSIIEQRINEASVELSHCKEYDFLVYNDHFDNALNDLQAILRSHRLLLKYQEVKHEAIISNLIE